MPITAPFNPKQIRRPRRVAEQLGVHVVTLWRWVRDGRFPAPLQLGPNTKGWTDETINAWLADRAGRP